MRRIFRNLSFEIIVQPCEIATVRVLGLATLGRIEDAGHLRAVQDLELGHFRRMQAAGFGNRAFCSSVGGRSATPLSASFLRIRSMASSTALFGLSSVVMMSV